MTPPGTGYDEIGSRTRQAWLRTGLGSIAVTLLVLRGLVLAGASTWTMIAALLPAVGFVAIAITRSLALQHGESEPMAHRMVAGSIVALSTLALLAGAGAAAGLMAR